MTHAEKLQQLFEAALKDSSDLQKPPTRAFPTPLSETRVTASPAAPAAAPAVEIPAGPVVNAGLSDTASAQPGSRLEEQHQQKTANHRLGAMITLGVFFALTGGGFCWFVQSPQRVAALQEAIRDVRSGGEIKSMVAKYDAALEKVAVRSKQSDQATGQRNLLLQEGLGSKAQQKENTREVGTKLEGAGSFN